MNKRTTQSMSLIVTILLLSAAHLGAFTSCPPSINQNGIWRDRCRTGHIEITWQALTSQSSFGFTDQALRRIAYANAGVDWNETVLIDISGSSVKSFGPTVNYRAKHHFDRAIDVRSGTAFYNASAYVAAQKQLVIALISGRDCGNSTQALDELGKALHAIQDAYSHSNYVDGLTGDEQGQFKAALWDPQAYLPQSLILTEYDPHPLTGGTYEIPDPDAANKIYSHRLYSKDSYNYNAEAAGPNVPPFGPTNENFSNAVREAEAESTTFVSEIRRAVTPEAWNQFVTGQIFPTPSSVANVVTSQARLQALVSSAVCPIDPCRSCIQVHHSTEIITSNDPNDKSGSQGSGDKRYLSAVEPLRYSIYYDNTKDAAAAQDVVVNDPLPKDLIDLKTVALGPITFVNTIITPPSTPLATLGSFTKDVDLRPSQDIIARVTASLDADTGLLSWHFQSLNPRNLEPTDEPLLGFLPAGADGSVLFTASARTGLPSNTDVTNTATVIFDGKPLPTPTWSNRLDSTPPTSKVLPFGATQNSSPFLVTWNAADSDSGLRDTTIYVSDNGGPFAPFITNTTSTQATYTGAIGHTYRFYSIARDLVGNVEQAKAAAEATTMISGGVPGDVNGDGAVNCSDIAMVKASLGKSAGQDGFNPAADVNGDQIVDVRDLAFVSQQVPAGTRCQ